MSGVQSASAVISLRLALGASSVGVGRHQYDIKRSMLMECADLHGHVDAGISMHACSGSRIRSMPRHGFRVLLMARFCGQH